MRWVSVVLFLVIVIFGAVRFGSSADLNAKQAQTKVQALREMQRPLPAERAASRRVVDPVATQEAEPANQCAQQNVATFKITQIILTFLAVVVTVLIIYLIQAGKQVDGVVKTFTFGSMTSIIGFWFYVPKQWTIHFGNGSVGGTHP